MKVSTKTILISIFIFATISCKKEEPVVVINPPPSINAGPDVVLHLPMNRINLSGKVNLQGNNLKEVTFLWNKIKGPNSYKIDNNYTLEPTLSELQKGEYWFELTATNSKGRFDRDTIFVFVIDPSVGHIKVYNDLEWIFPWYATLVIPNFDYYVPLGTPIKVFVQENANSGWIEVGPFSYPDCKCSYEYHIETRPDGAGMYYFGGLHIFNYDFDYMGDLKKKSNVKIIF